MDNTTKSTLYAELLPQLTFSDDKEIGKAAADLRDAMDAKETADMLAEILEREEVKALPLLQKLIYIALEFYGHGALAALYVFDGSIKQILAGE